MMILGMSSIFFISPVFGGSYILSCSWDDEFFRRKKERKKRKELVDSISKIENDWGMI